MLLEMERGRRVAVLGKDGKTVFRDMTQHRRSLNDAAESQPEEAEGKDRADGPADDQEKQ